MRVPESTLLSKELHENVCEETVFANVYNKYSEDLHNFLYYKYGEKGNPADKSQEAFVKLWENCAKVPLSKVKSFLFTVANNLMLNELKHQKVVLKYQQHKPPEHSHENPEFLYQEEEFLRQYQQALAKLSEEQRTAFLLNKAEGKKHQEIADMLGITRKVAEYRIYSAFELLRRELKGFSLK